MVGIPDSQKKTTAFKLPRENTFLYRCHFLSTPPQTNMQKSPPHFFVCEDGRKIAPGVPLKSYFTNLDTKLQNLNHF